jgi:O-antigen/teichoic acid export membrane protein
VSVFRDAAALAAAQTYYKVTGLVLLGVLSRSLPPATLGGLLWAQSLAESLVLLANLNLNPNLTRRVAAAPNHAAARTAPFLGLRLVASAAYLLLFAAIGLSSDVALRPILMGIAAAIVLEDLYFLFGALFLALGHIRLNLTIGLTVQTLYIAAVCLTVPRAGLSAFLLLSILRGVLLLIMAVYLALRSIPGLRIGWERGLLQAQLPLLGAAIVGALRGRMETVTAGWLLSLTASAPLALTQRVLVAATFLPASVVSTLTPALAREGDSDASRYLLRQAALLLGILGMLAGAILFIAPDLIARPLFGPDTDAGPLLRLAAPLLPLAFLETLAVGALQTWHREQVVLRVGVVSIVVYLPLAALLCRWYGVAGMLYAQIVVTALRTAWLGREAMRR